VTPRSMQKKPIPLHGSALHPQNWGVTCGNTATQTCVAEAYCNALQRGCVAPCVAPKTLSDLQEHHSIKGCNAVMQIRDSHLREVPTDPGRRLLLKEPEQPAARHDRLAELAAARKTTQDRTGDT